MTDAVPGWAALFEATADLRWLLATLALCAVRPYAAMAVLPPTNDQLLQGTVRNGLVLMIAAFIAFGQSVGWVEKLSPLQLGLLVVKEALIGMLIGFALSTVFWTAEAIGMLVDNYAGYNNVQQTNPTSGQASTPVGNLLMQLAVSGFYLLGGMTVFVGLLIDSIGWWPLVGAGPDWARLAERFFPTETATLLENALKIAGPVLVTLMLIDIGIGVLSKAAEKLEPNALSQPIKGAVAMLLLALLVGVFFDQVRHDLSLERSARRIEKLLAAPPAASAAR